MYSKKMKLGKRNKRARSMTGQLQSAVIHVAQAVLECHRDVLNEVSPHDHNRFRSHRQSLTWGFIVGLSSLALTTYNPALAEEPWQSQNGEQRARDAGSHVTGQGQFSRALFAQRPQGRQSGMQLYEETPSATIRVAANQDPMDPSALAVDIPAGDLHAALLVLGRQTNLQLLYSPELMTGRRSRGIQGTFTPKQALAKLLVGTGLEYRFSDAKTVTLQTMTIQGLSNEQNVGPNPNGDGTVIQADPIVIEETITRSKVFLPSVDGYKADKATTTTRTALPIQETPTSIGVVTRDLIRDTGALTQNEAFESVSGVSREVTRYGRSESFSIRGFSVAPWFLDGVSGLKSNGLPIDGVWAPDPAIIERYEIVKGPASITGGAANPGGIVNRITKSPQDDNFATSEFQAGSYGLYRGNIDVNGVLPQNKNLRGRLIFAVEEGGEFVDDIDVRQYTVAPSLELDLFGGEGTLLLTGHYQYFKGGNSGGFPTFPNGDAPDIPRTRNIGGGSANGVESTFEGQNYEAHYLHRFVENLTLSVKGKYSKSNRDGEDFYAYSYTYAPLTSEGTTEIDAGDRNDTFATYAGEVFLSKKFELFGQEHDVLVGMDFRDDRHDTCLAYTILGTDNIFNPANQFQFVSNKTCSFVNTASQLVQTGGFGQLVVRPTERLTLVGALRHDWADVKFDLRNTNVRQKDFMTDLTGRIGATLELFPWLNVYGGYQESFVPNLAATVDGGLLDSETGESYELGAKLSFFEGRLLMSTAFYRTYRRNVATTDPANRNFSIAVGEQRHQGVEFDINGQPFPGLKVNGQFSYLDAEVTETTAASGFVKGKSRSFLPVSYIGRIFATYELQTGSLQGLGFGAGAYFHSGYRVDNDEQFSTDSFQRVDAVVFYRPQQKAYEFTINVRNLLDATYIETFAYTGGYNQFGAPVSVFGTLRVKFDPDLAWSLW